MQPSVCIAGLVFEKFEFDNVPYVLFCIQQCSFYVKDMWCLKYSSVIFIAVVTKWQCWTETCCLYFYQVYPNIMCLVVMAVVIQSKCICNFSGRDASENMTLDFLFIIFFSVLFHSSPTPIEERSSVISAFVCLFVCLSAWTTQELYHIFCACFLWQWFGSRLVTWQYIT